MHTYQTIATVKDHGSVYLDGVPFAPGTEVEVAVSIKTSPVQEAVLTEEEKWAAAHSHIQAMLRTATGFRNVPRISREELYERPRFP